MRLISLIIAVFVSGRDCHKLHIILNVKIVARGTDVTRDVQQQFISQTSQDICNTAEPRALYFGVTNGVPLRKTSSSSSISVRLVCRLIKTMNLKTITIQEMINLLGFVLYCMRNTARKSYGVLWPWLKHTSSCIRNENILEITARYRSVRLAILICGSNLEIPR